MFILTCILAAFAGPNPGVITLTHVQPFQLEQATTYPWNGHRSSFDQGTLFVVEVDPNQAQPRQAGAPVLYVGNTPAARLNPGHLDSHIVAFVPENIDFSATPIFWGPSTLPERVRPDLEGQDALKKAKAKPFPAAEVNKVQRPKKSLQSEKHIHVLAADLIDQYAPQDGDFARGYRVGWRP